MKPWLPVLILVTASLAWAEAPNPWSPPGWTPSERLPIWLGLTEEFTSAKLQVLMNLAERDPEARDLVTQAMAKVKASTTEEFLGIFRTTPPNEEAAAHAKPGAEFTFGDYNIVELGLKTEHQLTEEDPSQLEPYRGRIERARLEAGVFQVSVERRTLYLNLHVFKSPSILLRRNENLQRSYEDFIHELTHLVYFDPETDPDPTTFESDEAYEEALLMKPGEEVEARIAGIRALCRQIGETPYFSSLPFSLEVLFNPDGSLIKPREEILGALRFQGYSQAGLWRNRLEVLKGEDARERFRLIERQVQVPPLSSEQGDRARSRKAKLDRRIVRAEELLRAP